MPFRIDPAKALFVLSCAAAIFAYGVGVGAYHLPPYRALDHVKDQAMAVLEDREMLSGSRPTAFLQPGWRDGEGVTRWVEGAAEPGLTLISGFFDDGNEVRLVRMDGSVVNRWPVQYSELWKNPDHVRPVERVPTTDWHVDIDGMLLGPDGTLAFNFAGLGLTKLDPCGRVVWQTPEMTHHTLERSSRGGYWVPGVEWIDTLDVNPYPPLIPPYWSHTILELDPEGRVLRKIALGDIFFGKGLEALVLANGSQSVAIREEDPFHLNDVEELPAAWADAYPLFEAGDLLLSMRDLNLVMVVDPEELVARWYHTGPWIRQHDPDFGPDGTITVYDNATDDAGGSILGGSAITRIDPETGEWSVLYGKADDQRFYSSVRGKHQKLDNGNLLITEHEGGRIFEVDPAGEVVWEFINRYGPDEVAEVTEGRRYPEDYVAADSWNCPNRQEAP